MDSTNKGNTLPSQGSRKPRDRRLGGIVPAPPSSSSDQGLSLAFGGSACEETVIAQDDTQITADPMDVVETILESGSGDKDRENESEKEKLKNSEEKKFKSIFAKAIVEEFSSSSSRDSKIGNKNKKTKKSYKGTDKVSKENITPIKRYILSDTESDLDKRKTNNNNNNNEDNIKHDNNSKSIRENKNLGHEEVGNLSILDKMSQSIEKGEDVIISKEENVMLVKIKKKDLEENISSETSKNNAKELICPDSYVDLTRVEMPVITTNEVVNYNIESAYAGSGCSTSLNTKKKHRTVKKAQSINNNDNENDNLPAVTIVGETIDLDTYLPSSSGSSIMGIGGRRLRSAVADNLKNKMDLENGKNNSGKATKKGRGRPRKRQRTIASTSIGSSETYSLAPDTESSDTHGWRKEQLLKEIDGMENEHAAHITSKIQRWLDLIELIRFKSTSFVNGRLSGRMKWLIRVSKRACDMIGVRAVATGDPNYWKRKMEDIKRENEDLKNRITALENVIQINRYTLIPPAGREDDPVCVNAELPACSRSPDVDTDEICMEDDPYIPEVPMDLPAVYRPVLRGDKKILVKEGELKSDCRINTNSKKKNSSNSGNRVNEKDCKYGSTSGGLVDNRYRSTCENVSSDGINRDRAIIQSLDRINNSIQFMMNDMRSFIYRSQVSSAEAELSEKKEVRKVSGNSKRSDLGNTAKDLPSKITFAGAVANVKPSTSFSVEPGNVSAKKRKFEKDSHADKDKYIRNKDTYHKTKSNNGGKFMKNKDLQIEVSKGTNKKRKNKRGGEVKSNLSINNDIDKNSNKLIGCSDTIIDNSEDKELLQTSKDDSPAQKKLCRNIGDEVSREKCVNNTDNAAMDSNIDVSMNRSGWSTVSRKGRRKDPKVDGANSASRTKSREIGAIPLLKRRIPKTAAVVITCTDNDISYAEALKRARANISLESLGIGEIRTRRAITGALIMELSGDNVNDKAMELEIKLKALFSGTTVRVSRPVRRAEVKIFGLDDSVEPGDIIDAVMSIGSCFGDEVKCSTVRVLRNGMGAAWVQCPISAALKIIEKDKIKIGWSTARVELVTGKQLQCFKCLALGHPMQRCPNKTSMNNRCYGCGENDHSIRQCKNKVKCCVCEERGLSSNHRAGGQDCQPCPPRDFSRNKNLIENSNTDKIIGARRLLDSKMDITNDSNG